jgi:peroxisomal 2,4-dienoyl-CoA reductase
MTSAFRTDLLDGKVALITGGGSGICKGIAQAFMAHGAHAALLGRKAERLQTSAQELGEQTGRDALPVVADVRDPDVVAAAMDRTLEHFGRLDIVVNGAAGNFLAPASQLSTNGFRTVLDIDAVGTFNVCRAAFDRGLSEHGGHIVNISATLHYAATPMQIHASAAKAAVDSVTRTLAVEWGPLGIRVCGIAPGPIEETEGTRRLASGEMREQLTQAIPIRRFGRIEEIAQVALFLVSPAASLVHGETVVADGGAWLGLAGAGRMGS